AFFRWFNDPVKGPGNQLFTCIVPSTRDVSDNEIEVQLIVDDGFDVCWEFFLVTSGNFIEMPRLLGYPAAKVALSRIDRGDRFPLTTPKRPSLLGRIGRLIGWPVTARAAARELQEAHETLRERFVQLQDAQRALERQRAVLDTAYQVGQRIWSERDPAAAA